MTLPKGYDKRLRLFDPLLRMRWSQQREEWILERKCARPIHQGFIEAWSDAAIQNRDGYFELGSYAPRELPNIDRLLNYLRWADTWNMGEDADTIADHMDKRWIDAQRRRKAHFRDEMGARAGEAYDTLAWQSGARVAVPR